MCVRRRLHWIVFVAVVFLIIAALFLEIGIIKSLEFGGGKAWDQQLMDLSRQNDWDRVCGI